MRFEFDISKVDLVTRDGIDLHEMFKNQMKKPFHQFVGGTIYENIRDIELDDKCKAIYKGEKVELNEREKDLFVQAIKAMEFKPGLIERKIMQQIVKIEE